MTVRDHTTSDRAERNRTTRRTFLRAAGATALAAGIGTASLSGTAAAAPNDSFVETDGAQFVIDGEPVYLNGSNNFWLMDTYYGTPSLHDTVFSLYDRLGLNFVRTWGFNDGESEHGPTLQPSPGEYNEEAFERFDSLVAKAGEYGIKLVLPLVNNWEEYGGKGQYVSWVDGASSGDDFYTNEECKQLYKDYVEYVLTRENTITGVEYRNDPAIAVWELANEPRASSLSVEELTGWVEEMSAHIKSIDSNHLVSTGSEGFYTGGEHGSSYPYRANEGVDYVAQHQVDTIDCCSYHMYPIAWNLGADNGSDWIAQHHVDAQETIGKPAYAGEFGLSTSDVSMSERNSYYQDWYDTLDTEDAAGAMVWQVVDGSRESPPRLDSPTHGIYEDDTETLSIVQDYGARARAKSGTALEPDAPSAPTGVGLSGRTDTSIDVVWNATVGWGAGADHYAVTLDGEEATTLPAGTTSTTVTGLDPSTEYTLAVRAVDVNGTRSASSETVTLATLPSEVSTVVDPCADTSMLAEASDLDALTTDTTNPEYFVRPDGEADDARINRSAAEDVAMVYRVDGDLLDLAVEFHENASEGGDIEYYESTDGGASWQAVEVRRTEYSPPSSGGWSSQLHSKTGFSEGVDRVKLVLTGGSAAWAVQVGTVELTVGDGSDEPAAPPAVGGSANAPTDPDGDTLFEDVDGDGELNFPDVNTLFQNTESASVQDNAGFYDFSGDGVVDMQDVLALFELV
ncbi:cellulase family glycosylhydrolase [Halococcoides cellulosivorans]|uniref:mannan endo-1,4-beta-mannosidase n=1 Tax=Halococcoides cellulosivorans TaxID=1679096 RepID=A0A2R4WYR1_9EURY|nr:cellulase family glycosylhydrolase [Halococcoides cellulosivorans]AWB26665.1 hypothetical protein HARCEL1_02525 [Halococcoides cellulosivorans]